MQSERYVTIVIPLVPSHDRFLQELIPQLSGERHVIAKVILARSSARKRELPHLLRIVRSLQADYGLDIEVLATHRLQLAGQNRNRGWHHVSTPFTAFLDADDEYAEDRISRLVEVARDDQSDLVIHDYLLKETQTDTLPLATWKTEDLIQTDALYAATFPRGRDRTREGSIPGDTNIHVPQTSSHQWNVCHGHILVRTELRRTYQYTNLYPGEDGQFCRDLLWGGRRVTYVPARLSAYRPNLSAETQAGYALRVGRKLARLRRQMRANLSG